MNIEILSKDKRDISNKILFKVDKDIAIKSIPEYISKSPSFIVKGNNVEPLNTTLKESNGANIFTSANNNPIVIIGDTLKEFDLISVPLDILKIAISALNLARVKKDLTNADKNQIDNEANINELLPIIEKIAGTLNSEDIVLLTQKDGSLTEKDHSRLQNLEAIARISDRDYKAASFQKYLTVANAAKQVTKVANIASKRVYLQPVLKAVGVDHPKVLSKLIRPYITGIYNPLCVIRSGTKAIAETKVVAQTLNENFQNGSHILPDDINKLMQENLWIKRNIHTLGSIGYGAKAIAKPFEISNLFVNIPTMILIVIKKGLDAKYLEHKSLIPDDNLADIGPLKRIYSSIRQSDNIQKLVDTEIDMSILNRPVQTMNFLHKYHLNTIDFAKLEVKNSENLIEKIESYKNENPNITTKQLVYLHEQLEGLNKKIEINQNTINTSEKDIKDLVSSIRPIDSYDMASEKLFQHFDIKVIPKEAFDPYNPVNIEKFRQCLRKEGIESLFLKELLQKNKEFYTVKSTFESDEKNTVVSVDFKKLYSDLLRNEKSETFKKAKEHMNLFYDVAGNILTTTLKGKHRQIKNQLLEVLFERIALNNEDESTKSSKLSEVANAGKTNKS